MKRFVVGWCATLLLAACSQDPSLYLGGPAGPTTRLQLSAGRVAMTVGETITVGAVGLDEVGNVAPEVPTFAACGSLVTVSPGTASTPFTAAATITAVPDWVGETCVRATAGAITDSVRIAIGPAGMTLAGPDTIVSGLNGTYTYTLRDATGALLNGNIPVEWSSSREDRMVTVSDQGEMTGRAPGGVSVRVRAPNGVNQSKGLVIIPDVFTGTLSVDTGRAGLLMYAYRGPTDAEFDADAAVTVGGQAAWVEVTPPGTILVAIPSTGSASARNFDLLSLGRLQLARRTTFTTTSATADVFGTSTASPDTTTAPRYVDVQSPRGYVYFAHSGFGTGASARGVWNGGTRPDHYFQFTTGATAGSVIATLLWTNTGTNADFDLEICRADRTGCTFWDGTSTSSEVSGPYALAANTTYVVMASCNTARSSQHNLRLRLDVTGTTIH